MQLSNPSVSDLKVKITGFLQKNPGSIERNWLRVKERYGEYIKDLYFTEIEFKKKVYTSLYRKHGINR